ncbi:MAG: phosphodiester glycosidase family protein [Synergistaceae bacterium]|jgi:exopolysaccharide biosynthesis protein|nr:phosphodiester glycosidase family protein [Synergistaceae bacterium]
MRCFFTKSTKNVRLRLFLAIFSVLLHVFAASAASAVRQDAFLSRLLAARGFEAAADVSANAAAILRSGIVTDRVSAPAEPVTRGNALRWAVQSLGLGAEANFLADLPLPFRDVKDMKAYDRGCLVVATHMEPPLFKKHSGDFGATHRLSMDEVTALMESVRRATRRLKIELRFSPAPGMELELHREGTFSGVPKWRVHVYGFDERAEADQAQKSFASQGLKVEAKNPNYEWSLRSASIEDYAQVRRLAALAEKMGKTAYIFPSLMNENLENQPFYWALLTIDPSRYLMEPIIAPGGITTLAPLSVMVNSSGARAAVNAGFFGVSGRNQGTPIGTLQIARSLVNKPYQGRTSLGWSRDNHAAFGEVAWNGTIQIDEGWMTIDALNRSVRGNAVALYNSYYGKPTPTAGPVTEVLVRDGVCVSVGVAGGTIIEPGTYVLAGYGTNAALLARYLKPGDGVRIDSTFNDGDPLWNGMDNVIQAGPFLLRNGEIRIESEGFSASILNLRHPRSVVGLTNGGKWVFFVGDGRNGMHSAGFTLQEAAAILKSKNVAWALNLDGGGSSQIMVDNRTFNVPSDGRERPLSYAIGVKER